MEDVFRLGIINMKWALEIPSQTDFENVCLGAHLFRNFQRQSQEIRTWCPKDLGLRPGLPTLPGGVTLDSRPIPALTALPYEVGHSNPMLLLRPLWEQMLAVHRRSSAFCPGTGSPWMSVGDRSSEPPRKKGQLTVLKSGSYSESYTCTAPIHTHIHMYSVRVCGQSCFLDHHMYQTTHFNFIL